MSEVCLAKISSVTVFLVTVDGQMVVDPVSCPAKIHCKAIFALRNGKFSKLGMTKPQYLP